MAVNDTYSPYSPHRGYLIKREQRWGGGTIGESFGLARAEVSHGGRDQVKSQYTLGEVDRSASLQARLQDSGRIYTTETSAGCPQHQTTVAVKTQTTCTPFN